MKKSKPKAKINDVFLHNEEKKMFIVVDKVKNTNGNLYTLKEVASGNDVVYKRYYEEKLLDKCSKSKNAKAVKILYGKKK